MRILFSSWPGYGHLLPMVPLIRAAELGGHEVVVSSGGDLAEPARRLAVPFRPSGLTAGEVYAALPRVGPIDAMPPEERVAFAARHLFGPGAVSRATDLAALITEWTPDLVVHDTFELGAAAAAGRSGIRHVTHGFGPVFAENDGMVAGISAYLADAGWEMPDVLRAPYLDIAPTALRVSAAAAWHDRRPLRPSSGEPDPDRQGAAALAEEIAALPRARTAYLTLGTVMNQAPQLFTAVLEGVADLDLNVVATTGPGVDPATVAPGLAWVLARTYLPQSDIMPRCDVVISHAGAGTMLGALCHGLPQLCLPLGTDQPLNAAAIVPTGAALSLPPDAVSPETVAQSVSVLLGDPSYTEAAGRIRAEIEAMPAADEVLAGLLG